MSGRAVAYLVNQYPKVSHTFIRREIEALEALGVEVERVSVRGSPEALRDPADEREATRTRVLLGGGARPLAMAVARAAVSRPAKLAKAAALALEVGWRSERGALRHAAYLAEACLLAEWLEARGMHHVHAHFGTNSATVAMLASALGGTSFSFTAHGPEEFDKALLIALAEKIDRASFVCAVSSFGRSQLLRHAALDLWDKIHVVRCGLDPSFLEAEATEVPATPRLACVGRLSEQKGQLLLLEAAGELAAEGVAFELVLVGDGEMRAEVEARIASIGLGGRVTITGWASTERVRAELLAARAMVLPSFAEGLPVVIMEALALGRPVISTYVAGIPELVEPGKSGWLTPAGAVAPLVAAMREALSTPPERLAEMGAHGRGRVKELHDVRRSAEALAALFAKTG